MVPWNKDTSHGLPIMKLQLIFSWRLGIDKILFLFEILCRILVIHFKKETIDLG